MEDLWRACNAEACKAGRTHYLDPSTGYQVFSEFELRKRGKCCGCGCRHCPYNHGNVSMAQRAKRIQNAAFLNGDVEGSAEVDVLFWSGGKDSFLALRALKRAAKSSAEPRPVVLLTTFEVRCYLAHHVDFALSLVPAFRAGFQPQEHAFVR
jgi:ATP-binding cassette subfamily B (MDR/TAP) protein 1